MLLTTRISIATSVFPTGGLRQTLRGRKVKGGKAKLQQKIHRKPNDRRAKTYQKIRLILKPSNKNTILDRFEFLNSGNLK